MSPTTSQEWIKIASERAADARALLEQRPRSIGTIYLAGYAVECTLKAYLQKYGIPVPTSGRGGHDLRNLWYQAGFRLADLGDSAGAKSFFVTLWSTDLRYASRIESNCTHEALVQGAAQLVGWIQTQLRRRGRRT
ncbi:MAG: HEPN domain-containing protein [Candidatus Competibacteraceae bacterium]